MARARRWSITFAALNNTIYTAYIYDEGWTGNVIALTPTSNPFETQEDTNEDAFSPVRTSTGYVRFIVQDLNIIDSFMCNTVDGRYIELVQGNNVLWQGYVQAQTFTCPWDSAPYEIEFPVVSALGLLENLPYTPDREFESIGYIIKKALTNNGTIDFLTWHTPTRGTVLDLSAKLNDRIFKNSNIEEWVQHVGYNANIAFPPEKVSCLSVIEDICRYFGWSLYERGKDLYFVSVAGTTNYQYGLFSAITSSGLVTPAGTETATSGNLPQVVSASNTRRFLKGYGYFQIEEKMGTPAEPVNFDISQAAPESTEVKQSAWPDCLYINNGSVINTNIVATESKTGDVFSGNNYGCQLVRIKITDEWYLENPQEFKSEYKPSLVVRYGTVQRVALYQSVFDSSGRTFPGGLALSAEVNYWLSSSYKWDNAPSGTKLKMKIQWGNKYLTYDTGGTNWHWTTTESTINVPIDGGRLHGGRIILWESGGFTISKIPEDMLYIPVDQDLNGILRIYIYATAEADVSEDYIVLSDFKLQAYQPNAVLINENIDYSENRFRATGSMGGRDVLSIQSHLCSAVDEAQSGDAMVLKADMSDALDTIPETDTVTRMAAMYGTPCEQVEVDVRGINFKPYDKVRFQSTTYCVVSVQTDWIDNRTRLQLQKINS